MGKDEALKLALRLCEEALPKFNWGASFLDANAIQLLNTVPAAIKEALAQPAIDPVHEYRKGFIAGQIDMRDRPEEQPAQEPVNKTASVWQMFPGYLIENCEGHTITEEGLQRALADMLANPEYTTPPKRKWVGLTPEETSGFTQHEMTVVKYASKVLKEKNNG